MEIAILVIDVLRRMLQKAGPYLVVEIVLPGGTLIALALALYRHRKSTSTRIWKSERYASEGFGR